MIGSPREPPSGDPTAARGVEIERKFKLERVPAELLGAEPGEPVEQGYVAIDGDGTEVRIRRRGERCTLTVKAGSGLSRAEEEFDVATAVFAALWPFTAGRRISKVRSRIELDGGLTVELDRYTGELDGLVTAEVEFASEQESARFSPPPWLGSEITGDRRYRNQTLATSGLPR
jgi:adenylate cyclase